MMDLGPGRDTSFRYVLVYIELTTRFVWIRPLATKEAVLVAREVGGCWPPRWHTRLPSSCPSQRFSLSLPGSSPHPTPLLQVYFLWMDTQAPARLQSDNGTEFCNWILDLLCGQFGVDHICGSVGHPQSQGAVERCNGFIKNKIRALLMTLPTVRRGAALAAAAAVLHALSTPEIDACALSLLPPACATAGCTR